LNRELGMAREADRRTGIKSNNANTCSMLIADLSALKSIAGISLSTEKRNPFQSNRSMRAAE
jgi:hypothetical protein